MIAPCLRVWVALALTLTALGCRSAVPTAYYSLNTASTTPVAETGPSEIRVGLGPIVLPGYLERHQMVVRSGPNELRIDDDHVWAAPLSEELPRVLAENLMLAKPSLRVTCIPWGARFAPEIVVAVRFSRFEAQADGRAVLDAVVTLSGRSESSWSLRLEDQAAGRTRADMVAAQSRLLGEFGRRIAAAIP
jgi:uncharacterized protein